MSPSEQRAEYALRIVAAPVAAVIAAGVVALVLGLVCLPFRRFDWVPVDYASTALEFFARGFVFVWVGSFVLPGRWRLRGAVVLTLLGIGLQVYMMRSYTSDPEPPLWPLFAATAGGVMAAAVQYFRRLRNES